MSGDAIGMMEGAYFVSRGNLLGWLNGLLKTDYEKVEHACTGVAYLQILDALFPGEVPLHKANFQANPALSYECLVNYKLLQEVFNRKKLDRAIPVERLVKGRYQDNLEFLQWMKSYFEKNYKEGEPYDPVARREEAKRQYTAAHGRKRSAPLRSVGNTPLGSPSAKSAQPKTPLKSPVRTPLKGSTKRRRTSRAKDPTVAGTTPNSRTARPAPMTPEEGTTKPEVLDEAPAAKRARADDPAPPDEVSRLRQDLRQAEWDLHVKSQQALLYCSKLKDISLAVKSCENPEAALGRVMHILGMDHAAQPLPPAVELPLDVASSSAHQGTPLS